MYFTSKVKLRKFTLPVKVKLNNLLKKISKVNVNNPIFGLCNFRALFFFLLTNRLILSSVKKEKKNFFFYISTNFVLLVTITILSKTTTKKSFYPERLLFE